MNYYKISIIGSVLEPLTYFSEENIPLFTQVTVSLNKREKLGVVIEVCDKPDFNTLEILATEGQFFSQAQSQLAKFIASYYICSLGEAFALMSPYEIPGLSPRMTVSHSQLDWESKITLSKKQNDALNFLQEHKVSLLFGDTGSGKTEIYMKYFEKILSQNKRALFLMPEISLTPQMSKRLEEHFGESFIMWHSKLTPKQKKDVLAKIHSGEAKIIAGARSSLFLPVKDLGLIVVDEEHDDSYKSSSRPRYNARDIAVYMGKLYDIPVVLGSATPSFTSYVKFPHYRLKGGYYQTQKEYIYEAREESLTPLIFHYLKNTVKEKKQSIVFLPTRANFKYLVCKDCGATHQCPYCSVGMSIHHKANAIKCHYCNYMEPIPKKCTQCGSEELTSSRIGTAEALKEIESELADAKVEQFDRDTITTANKLKKALKRFNDKEVDILVGTQMLSKGHDYHDVELAVILGMDNMLSIADYRAREKTLSSLIQVAGRSGRASDAKVLIQTYNEEFFKTYINDYEAFLDAEKLFREELYPPYKKLCRVLFADKNGLKAQDKMREMEQCLKKFDTIEVVGAKKCAVEKVANKYRFEILLRADKAVDLIKAIRGCKTTMAEIDMDPIDFA